MELSVRENLRLIKIIKLLQIEKECQARTSQYEKRSILEVDWIRLESIKIGEKK